MIATRYILRCDVDGCTSSFRGNVGEVAKDVRKRAKRRGWLAGWENGHLMRPRVPTGLKRRKTYVSDICPTHVPLAQKALDTK